MWAAPIEWCSEQNELVELIVVAADAKKGLIVSRLIKVGHADALVSDCREYEPVSLTSKSA